MAEYEPASRTMPRATRKPHIHRSFGIHRLPYAAAPYVKVRAEKARANAAVEGSNIDGIASMYHGVSELIANLQHNHGAVNTRFCSVKRISYMSGDIRCKRVMRCFE